MNVIVRPLRPEDARGALEVHHSAVRVTAASDYPAEVVEQWAQMPITEKAVAGFNANLDEELRFVADLHGQIVGFAAIVTQENELRACYVAPGVARQGVGRTLIEQLEQTARERGLKELRLDSSVTAHAFYTVMGYETVAWGEHVLGSGHGMSCVFMRKTLF